MKSVPTYGEELTRYSFDVNSFKYAFHEVPKVRLHQSRMSNKNASTYYTNKIRKEFLRLGYVYKVKEDYEYRKQGFDSVDDYYDYFEAQRLKEMM